MAKTLRVQTRTGWTTKPVADLAANRLTAEEVDNNFLALEDEKQPQFTVVAPESNGTDDSTEINALIAAMPATGGTIVFSSGVWHVTNILPKSNVTLDLRGAILRQVPASTTPMIHYSSATTLRNFNIFNGTLDGNSVAQNIINIVEPSPSAPKKTWDYSTLKNLWIINSGAIGLYCPIPGRIRMISCNVHSNDIGLAWDREHIDAYGTTVEHNRIGVRSTGNHFVWLHSTVAHNTEKGWTTVGTTGYSNIYESGFIGCTFIDNGTHALQGPLLSCRIIGCRFQLSTTHVSDMDQTVIQGNHFGAGASVCAIDLVKDDTLIQGNFIEQAAIGIRTASASRGITISANNFETMSEVCVRLVRPTRLSINDNIFKTSQAGVYGETSGGDIGFTIDNNKFHITAGIGIQIAVATGDVSDISLSYNRFWQTGLEAIRLEGTGATLGGTVSGNQITDANFSNTAGTHAVHITRNLIGCTVSGNLIRNSGSGQADHAILFTAATATETLFDGNVARNMKGSYAYDLPGSGVTVGTNIGTVAP